MNVTLTVRLTLRSEGSDLEHNLREAVGLGRPDEAWVDVLDAVEDGVLKTDDVELEHIEFDDD